MTVVRIKYQETYGRDFHSESREVRQIYLQGWRDALDAQQKTNWFLQEDCGIELKKLFTIKENEDDL